MAWQESQTNRGRLSPSGILFETDFPHSPQNFMAAMPVEKRQRMDSTKHQFFAPCPRGLESVLEQEVRALGIPVTAAAAGGVSFQAPWSTMYWVNLWSHLASRVLWQVGHRAYRTEDDIYQAAYGLPWSDWFTSSNSIKVRVSAHRCPLPSLDFVTLRVKDAVCDRFVALTGRRPTVDRNHPDIRIDAFIDSQTVTLYLDTSGEPLFKRGYRLNTVVAPLRENLAAGLLRLAGGKAARMFHVSPRFRDGWTAELSTFWSWASCAGSPTRPSTCSAKITVEYRATRRIGSFVEPDMPHLIVEEDPALIELCRENAAAGGSAGSARVVRRPPGAVSPGA